MSLTLSWVSNWPLMVVSLGQFGAGCWGVYASNPRQGGIIILVSMANMLLATMKG